jgi:GNAT superfamily N-acetyltransferase
VSTKHELKPEVEDMNDVDEEAFPFSDLALSRRLERAEAQGNLEFVEARARAFPESGAEWIEVAGAYAMYDGVASPMTQTFGLGLFQPITDSELDTIEEFFRKRGAEVFHEVSPLAGESLMSLLNERGYRPMELTSVMCRPIRQDINLTASRNEKLKVRLIREDEHRLWAETSAKGWSEYGDLVDFMLELGEVSAKRANPLSFIAEVDAQPIATGVLIIHEGVALMAGASTIPEGRKQGAQLALLEHRLRYAAAHGCDLAMMCAQPGSASQRNAERHGFRIVYTRIKWQLSS